MSSIEELLVRHPVGTVPCACPSKRIGQAKQVF
jgi:hypothetical protein